MLAAGPRVSRKSDTFSKVETLLSVFYFSPEFNLTSFCRETGPLSYSRLKFLRLDGNKLTYNQLPQDWVYCLRVIQSIYI